ncbi:MAG: hypothetical protein V3V67_06825 [Myxococcota bacterium]
MQGVIGLILIFGLAACASSYSQRAERIQTGVLGLSGRDIIRCMGPPEDLDYESDLHGLWVYVRPLERPLGFPEEDPAPVSGPPDWGGSPRRSSEPNLRDADRKRERAFLENPTTAPIAAGYCLLKFEVADDAVRGFEARGRTRDGLNADSRCALAARYCVE